MKAMLFIPVCAFVLLLALSTPLIAQNGEEADTPETIAIKKAIREKEPGKMLEALQKVLIDYPDLDAELVSLINKVMLSSLIEVSPDKKERIAEYARKYIEYASNDEKYKTYLEAAKLLSDKGVLLDQAAEYAVKGVSLLTQRRTRQINGERAEYLLMLGDIYIKQGKKSDALRVLKEAHGLDPETPDIQIELARMEKEAGNYPAALEYLIAAVLNGGVTPQLRMELVEVYTKVHNKSIEELEKALDAAYQRRYPSVLNVERYKPTPSRSNRVVLAELFTSSSCPPCVALDISWDAVLQRYGKNEVAVLMYHINAPSVDPMTNPAAEVRARYYGISSTPSYLIDGRVGKRGGDALREEALNYYNPLIQKIDGRLEVPAQAEIKLEASFQGSKIIVKGNVLSRSEAPNLKLQIALVEDMVRFSGENTIRFHQMVVRYMAQPETKGYAISPLKLTPVEYTFDLVDISNKLKIASEGYEKKLEETLIEKRDTVAPDPRNLSVVAFVQDEQTKQILQAVYLKTTPVSQASSK